MKRVPLFETQCTHIQTPVLLKQVSCPMQNAKSQQIAPEQQGTK